MKKLNQDLQNPGLVGSKKEVKMFIDTFRSKSIELAKLYPKLAVRKLTDIGQNLTILSTSRPAAYMFHKILSN